MNAAPLSLIFMVSPVVEGYARRRYQWAMRIALALLIIAAASQAAAQPYGSPAGCNLYARGEVYGVLPDGGLVDGVADDPYLLLTDDALLGLEFRCLLSSIVAGRIACTGEGEDWTGTFSLSRSTAAATVIIDGDAYVLSRCPAAKP